MVEESPYVPTREFVDPNFQAEDLRISHLPNQKFLDLHNFQDSQYEQFPISLPVTNRLLSYLFHIQLLTPNFVDFVAVKLLT